VKKVQTDIVVAFRVVQLGWLRAQENRLFRVRSLFELLGVNTHTKRHIQGAIYKNIFFANSLALLIFKFNISSRSQFYLSDVSINLVLHCLHTEKY
jgi:hypothetical protein